MDRIRQVVTNLVGNSIKFTDHGEIEFKVVAEAFPKGETRPAEKILLHFSVRDTGIGIPQAKQKLIFDPFVQADSSTTRTYGGTGLGLAISMRLVTRMGGRMWLESREGSGSTFHFTIPCESAGADPPYAGRQRRLRGPARYYRVDRGRQRYQSSNLGRNALQVGCSHEFHRSRDYRSGVSCVPPSMPEMDGFAVAEQIKSDARFQAVPIMMLSSIDLMTNATRLRDIGAQRFLVKPVAHSELHADLMSILRPGHSSRHKSAIRTPKPRLRDGIRVLVAEDNLVNQKVVSRMLEREGCTVRTVEDGLQAVRALESEAFDIVLMDIHMPGMSGLEAARIIRSREAGTEDARRSLRLPQTPCRKIATGASTPEWTTTCQNPSKAPNYSKSWSP